MRKHDPSFRAGFWRRLFALVIDFIVVTAIIAPIGLWLGSATSGSIRISNTIVDHSVCAGGTMPTGLQLPSGFRVSSIVQCTNYFFGIPHDWLLSIVERTPIGPMVGTCSHAASPFRSIRQANWPIHSIWTSFLRSCWLHAYFFWNGGLAEQSVNASSVFMFAQSTVGRCMPSRRLSAPPSG